MRVLNFIESLSLALSGAPGILNAIINALLGKNCAEIDVRVLHVLESLSEGREVLKLIPSGCIRQMKSFMADNSSESVNMSRVVPYLKDDIFAEEVKGIHRGTLEAATPNQAASMNTNNCSLFHLEGLRKESQLKLGFECFATSLRSHLSSVSHLSPEVTSHFLRVESVRRSIPVQILQYPIPSDSWNKMLLDSLKSFAGFETVDWSSYINPNLPDKVLCLAITSAIKKVKMYAIVEMARRHLNFSDHNSLDLKNVEIRAPEIGFLAFNLDSGAKVFVKEASSRNGKPSKYTEVRLKVKSGSDQNSGVGGLAHLVEHVVLATPIDFGGQSEGLFLHCEKLMPGLGTVLGKTGREYTTFSFKVSDNFEDLCHATKVFSISNFSMNTVASEIKHVESESKLKGHKIDFFEVIYPHFHPENPAKNFAMGNLLSLTRDDILEKANEFYQSYYCAENIEIYVSSPLPAEVSGLMIQNFFSGLPRCEKKLTKDLPSNIWASKVDDVFYVYEKDYTNYLTEYTAYAFPCHEEEYICTKAIDHISRKIKKNKLLFSSGGNFYMISGNEEASIKSPQPDSLIQGLQAAYYKKKYGELNTNIRISKVARYWINLYRDPDYHRYLKYGKLPKKLRGSPNLIKHPYESNLFYSLETPSEKKIIPLDSFLSVIVKFWDSEKDFLKFVILKFAQQMGIKSPLVPEFLIEFSNTKAIAVVTKYLETPENYEKDLESVAEVLKGELPEEFRPAFALAAKKFNTRQKVYYRRLLGDSFPFLSRSLDYFLDIENAENKNLNETIGFPLQPNQWSCISEWKVSAVAEVVVKLPQNESPTVLLQEEVHKYFPPVPDKKLVPVLPKAGEFFYLAAESPFDDNAVVFSFILDATGKKIFSHLSLLKIVKFTVYFFFRHQNNSAYHSKVKVSDRDFRVIIQSFQDPHYLFNLFNRFIFELPNIFVKEFPRTPRIAQYGKFIRDYLLSDRCGAILIELWSSKELDWESRKEAHFRYIQEQKGDKLKVYHNYCDYPAIEIQ